MGFQVIIYSVTLYIISIAGLSWASAFKRTGVQLELLQDENMYQFFENGIRGGSSFVNKHHIRRYVEGEDDFDSALPRTEMLYIDAVSH